MNYLEEQKEWDDIVRRIVGADAVLLSVSVHSSDCRVYRSAAGVYKMRRLTPSACWNRLNWLADEFLALKHLASIPGVPVARSYQRLEGWEVIVMDALPELRGYDPTFGQPRESLRDFWSVVRRTREINRLGYSHGDLHIRNVGRNVDGGLSFFDFDQARSAHPLRCTLRDVFGFTADRAGAQVSLFDRARDVKGVGLLPRALTALRKVAIASVSAIGGSGPKTVSASPAMTARVALTGDPALESLAQAWQLAARSNASAPGVPVAYYSLDVSGINFPGERPWIQRWHYLKSKVNFRGMRFLELGCNMGLLSVHAKLSGASHCVGIDRDSDILRAATLAAKGFGVDVQFRQLDLDSIDHWDVEPEQFDIVSALSVMHWIGNKASAWAFLSRFKQLLYEGHEAEDEAEQSLRNAGFRRVIRLGSTERSRQMFLAYRDDV